MKSLIAITLGALCVSSAFVSEIFIIIQSNNLNFKCIGMGILKGKKIVDDREQTSRYSLINPIES